MQEHFKPTTSNEAKPPLTINIPDRFCCKITREIMRDPVIAPDGYTYEREAIEEALKRNPISPMSKESIEMPAKLTPNRDSKSDISEFLQHHPELYATHVYLSKAAKQEMISAIQENMLTTMKKLAADRRLLTTALNEEGLTALHVACKTTHLSLILELLQLLGEDIDTILKEKLTVEWKPDGIFLIFADLISQQKITEITDLDQAGVSKFFNYNTADETGKTLLQVALLTDSSQVVETVLTLGSNNWQAVQQDGKTCLHCAVLSGHLPHVMLCIKFHSVLLDTPDLKGKPPLLYAIEKGQYEIAQYLLEKGANYKHADREGKQALHYAANPKNSLALIKLLQTYSVDMWAKDNTERQLIHYAAMGGNIEIFRLLPADTAVLSLTDAEGNQPLHLAAVAGHIAIVEYLLSQQVDLHAKNHAGFTAQALAMQNGHTQVSAMLGSRQKTTQKILKVLQSGDNDRLAVLLKKYPYVISEKVTGDETLYDIACKTNNRQALVLLQNSLAKDLLPWLTAKKQPLTVIARLLTLQAAIIRLDFPVITWCLAKMEYANVIKEVPETLPHIEHILNKKDQIDLLTTLDEEKIAYVFNKTSLKIWDSCTKKHLFTLEGHQSPITQIEVTKNEKLISVSARESLKIWDIKTGKCLHTLKEEEFITLLPEEKIVCRSQKNIYTTKIWNSQTGECLHTLEGAYFTITSSQETLVSKLQDNTLKIWDVKTGKCLHTVKEELGSIYVAGVLPDGKITYVLNENKLAMLDSQTGQCIPLFVSPVSPHQYGKNSICGSPKVSPQGNIFFISSNYIPGNSSGYSHTSSYYEHTLKIYNSKTKACVDLKTLNYTSDSVKLEGILAGERIASVTSNSTTIWDGQTGKELHVLRGQMGWAFPSGEIVAVTRESGNTLQILDSQTGQCLHTLQEKNDSLVNVIKLSEKKIALILKNDTSNTIKIWKLDTQSIALQSVLDAHESKRIKVEKSKNYRMNNSDEKIISLAEFTHIKAYHRLKQHCLLHTLSQTPFESLEQLERTLVLLNIDILDEDLREKTLFHLAAGEGNLKLVKLLRRKEIPIDIKTGKSSLCSTALHLAAERNQSTVVRYLLAEGANIDAGNEGSQTALQLALHYECSSSVKVLVGHGARLLGDGNAQKMLDPSYMAQIQFNELLRDFKQQQQIILTQMQLQNNLLQTLILRSSSTSPSALAENIAIPQGTASMAASRGLFPLPAKEKTKEEQKEEKIVEAVFSSPTEKGRFNF